MNDTYFIEDISQAHELFKPLRREILAQLAEPHSCPEVAKALGLTTQKVYYHVKVLESEGIVRMVSERRVRGIMEGVYQAAARSFWLSPHLVKRLGGQRRVTDQISLQHLLSLAEELQVEVGHLAGAATDDTPSVGISANIELDSPDARAAFLADLQQAVKELAQKYGARSDDSDKPHSQSTFRLMVACYPQRPDANMNLKHTE